MSMKNNLKEFLEELIQEIEQELDEATTTANVAGYNVPGAFSDGGRKDKKRKKKIATQFGYKIVGKMDESINEASDSEIKKIIKKKEKGGPYSVVVQKGNMSKHISHSQDVGNDVNKAIKVYHQFKKKHRAGVQIIDGYGRTVFFESVNEGKFKPSQVRSVISRVKKQLMRKWKQKGGYENFGQKELRQLQNKFDYNAYGDKDEREISHMLDAFDNWAMNYDGNMREDISEAKVKRPVNRWLELKNDETMHPHKKMAMGLKELKYQLRETEKFFNWYNKIKTMNELDSDNYWKRTNRHIYTIKEKLINIAKTIQEIEK